jgi:hypothetical protein
MSPARETKSCAEIAPLLGFYVCDEVNDSEHAFIEQHLSLCAACREQVAEEKNFQSALGSLVQAADRLDSSGVLLSQCRSELAEKLDDLSAPAPVERTPRFGFLRRWMALRPAWSGAALVAFGLLVGAQSSQWYSARHIVNPLDQAVNIRPGPRVSDDQLSRMDVAGVNFTPIAAPGTQNVHVRLSAEEPLELSGSLDDSDVRRVLTYVVRNGDRFESGVRLDCLDALKSRYEDTEVRSALLSAARKDQNPAVRLKALEALRGAAADQVVRETLLQSLQHDSNPGVRVEAVNLLVRSLEVPEGDQVVPVALPPLPGLSPLPSGAVVPTAAATAAADQSLENIVRTLEELQYRDPSRYVRLRSAAALRELSSRNEQ